MESDHTKKLLILSEIDDLKVIANNNFLMGKFNEAIKITERIIEIAENAKLYSIAREQANFVGEIFKKIKEADLLSVIREEFESIKKKYELLIRDGKISVAHQLIIKFRKKFEKYFELRDIEVVRDLIEADENNWNEYKVKETSLKKQLEPLEIQLHSYLSTNNLILAKDVISKAKPLLRELKDTELLKMWDTSEAMFIALKNQIDINKEVEKALKHVSKLTDKYQFEQSKITLKNLIERVRLTEFSEHLTTLENKLKNIVDAEAKYKKLESELIELEKKVNENVSNNLFQIAINNINQIIKISRFIGKSQHLEKYTKYIEKIEKKIKRIRSGQEVKDYVKVLNIKAVQALKKGDFSNALERFEEIVLQLKNFI
jgi:tetratricopeptide (TPR) repeat protein